MCFNGQIITIYESHIMWITTISNMCSIFWQYGCKNGWYRGQKTVPVCLVERRNRRALIQLVLHHVRTGSADWWVVRLLSGPAWIWIKALYSQPQCVCQCWYRLPHSTHWQGPEELQGDHQETLGESHRGSTKRSPDYYWVEWMAG